MKTEDEIRAEFEVWWNKQPVPNHDAYFDYDCTHKQCGYEAYKACQRLNDDIIAAKDAEIARLRELLCDIDDTNNRYSQEIEKITGKIWEQNDDK